MPVSTQSSDNVNMQLRWSVRSGCPVSVWARGWGGKHQHATSPHLGPTREQHSNVSQRAIMKEAVLDACTAFASFRICKEHSQQPLELLEKTTKVCQQTKNNDQSKQKTFTLIEFLSSNVSFSHWEKKLRHCQGPNSQAMRRTGVFCWKTGFLFLVAKKEVEQ